MIQIYKPDNTNYQNNGDAPLFPVSAVTRAELNGAWTAELTHKIDQRGTWKYLVENAVVKMPSFNGDQLYRVKTKSKTDSGVTVTMEPIFMDSMGDCFLVDVRPTGKNGQEALDIMCAENSKYSGESNITKTATSYYQDKNLIEAINGDDENSFVSRWGGEILYDNFVVKINERVGGDYGIELRYGKNIKQDGVTEEVDTTEIVTRIYPKAYNGYTMSNNGYVDSGLINTYPTVHAVTMTFEDVKMRADASEDDEENGVLICDSQAQLDIALTQRCQEQYEAGIDKPKVTISADMVLLQNTTQYKDYQVLETVSLGDTVHIIHNRLGIITDARVIELEYDSIKKRVASVVIGDYKANYFDGVTSSIGKIDKVVRPDGTVVAEQIAGFIDATRAQIHLQSTAAAPVEGIAFKVEDLDPDSDTYGAMVWGTQGIQISKQRTADGRDWDWTAAMTANGIIADTIVAGTISDRTGRNYWNLDTGEFSLSSAAFAVDGEEFGDYVGDLVNDKIGSASVVTLQLTNDYAAIATDADGNGGDFSGCSTTAQLFYGTSDVSGAATYSATPSDGVSGEWNTQTRTYTVTGMTTDQGEVTIQATWDTITVSKVFTIVKQKQGADGTNGTDGIPGATYYTWIKYADTPTTGMSDEPEGKTYLGIAYNKTTQEESDNYTDYEWSLIKGTDGINGTNGEDGTTYYTWIKYADDDNGQGMSDLPDGKEFIGFAYNKLTPDESDNPSDYAWAKFRGDDGIPGTDGTDGKTSYFHVKYSAIANPTDSSQMSETPNTYIGTYVDFTEADSTDPSDYVWAKFEGTDGIPGTNGENGQTSYLHIKYSDDGGFTFTDNNGETPGEYMGVYVDFTEADSTDPEDYKWSLTKGQQGEPGRSYHMELSAKVIKKDSNGEMYPSQIEIALKYIDGQSSEPKDYFGKIKIEETTDGTSYTQKYMSSSLEYGHTYTPSDTASSIRITMYSSSGTQVLDIETVAILVDVDNLTQEQVFDILTDGGRIQGIFMQDGQLYFNGQYMKMHSIYTDSLNVGIGGNLYYCGYDTLEHITNDTLYYNLGGNTGVVAIASVNNYGPGSQYDYGIIPPYGTKSIRLVTSGSTDTWMYLGSSQNDYGCIPVTSGKTYRLSCYVRVLEELVTDNIPCQLYVVGHTSINNVNTGHPASTSFTAVKSEWTRPYVDYTADGTYPYISVRIDADAPSTTFWCCFQIEEITSDEQETSPFRPAGTLVVNGANMLIGSIGADKISINDLVALNATIGKWHIAENYLWSEYTTGRYSVIKSDGDVMIATNSTSRTDTTGATCQIWHDGHITVGDTAGGGIRAEIYGDTFDMYNQGGYAFQLNYNGGMELWGNADGNPTPYIDFHYDGSQQDYSVRLICNGPDSLSVEGGTLNTGSDEILKKDMASFDKRMETFFRAVNPIYFRYQEDTDKLQFGYSANNIEDALIAAGFDADDVGIYYKDVNGIRSLAINGMEAPNTYMIQRCMERITALETLALRKAVL